MKFSFVMPSSGVIFKCHANSQTQAESFVSIWEEFLYPPAQDPHTVVIWLIMWSGGAVGSYGILGRAVSGPLLITFKNVKAKLFLVIKSDFINTSKVRF